MKNRSEEYNEALITIKEALLLQIGQAALEHSTGGEYSYERARIQELFIESHNLLTASVQKLADALIAQRAYYKEQLDKEESP